MTARRRGRPPTVRVQDPAMREVIDLLADGIVRVTAHVLAPRPDRALLDAPGAAGGGRRGALQ